jgi:hypothetical protein
MVTLKRDRKAKDCWLITTTDREGFHRQLAITFDDMRELVRLWIDEYEQRQTIPEAAEL